MNCIEINNLSYRFATDQMILDKINLQQTKGSIYGFFGPKGAGKTTTSVLCRVCSLSRKRYPNFDKPFYWEQLNILGNIGSMIEMPSI